MQLSPELKRIFTIFVVWKLALVIFAYYAAIKLPNAANLIAQPPQEIPGNLSIWFFWDAKWLYAVTTHGYTVNSDLVVFFPLLAIVTKIISPLVFFNVAMTGLILNTVFSFISVVYLFKLARLDFDQKTSTRAAIYFLIFPAAIFLSAFYTEALFLALAISSLYYARNKKFVLAGLLAGFATLTRIQGVVLMFPILLEYLEVRNFNFTKLKFVLLSLSFVPAALIAYMVYLKNLFGNPLLFMAKQKNWGREFIFSKISKPGFTNPFFDDPLGVTFKFITAPSVLVTAFFAVLGVLAYKIRRSYGIYIFVSLLLLLSSGTLSSAIRISITCFPAFLVLAKFGEDTRINFAISFVFILFLGLFTALFVNGFWVS